MVEFLIRFWNYFVDLPFAYQFVSTLIFFLVTSSFFLFIAIMIARSVKNRKESIYNKNLDKYEDFLTELMFDKHYERDSKEYKNMLADLKLQLGKTLARLAFLKTMYELHANLVGQSAVYIEHLYQDLGLYTHALKKIKRGEWYKKAQGFRELSEFNVVSQVSHIKKYTDDSNKALRGEAQFACVHLQGVEGLDFVPKLTTILSEWQQLSILEQLKKIDREKIPCFTPWLKNSNFSVRVFALKLISFFNQFEFTEYIPQLLTDEDDKVKIQLMKTMSHLQITEYNELVQSHYPTYSHAVKVQTVKAFSHIGQEDDQYFLFEQVATKDYDIVLQSAYALIILGFTDQLKMFKAFENPFNRRVIQHALDERI